MLRQIVPIVTKSRKTGNHQRRVNSSSSRQHLKTTFVPVPKRYLVMIPRRLRAAFLELWEHGHGRPCLMPYRLLAARLGCHSRTAQAHCYALKKLGHIEINGRRISRFVCASNVFSFPKLQGFFAEKAHGATAVEMLRQINTLKAKAPRAVRVEENHPPVVRKLHGIIADLLGRLKKQDDRRQWRLEKARKRTGCVEDHKRGSKIIELAQEAVLEQHRKNLEAWGWKESEVSQ